MRFPTNPTPAVRESGRKPMAPASPLEAQHHQSSPEVLSVLVILWLLFVFYFVAVRLAFVYGDSPEGKRHFRHLQSILNSRLLEEIREGRPSSVTDQFVLIST